MIRQTSLEAYEEIKPELGDRQRQVFLFIERTGQCNNLMISKGTGLPINSITPRTGELKEMGLIEECGKFTCPYTGRMTIFVRAK